MNARMKKRLIAVSGIVLIVLIATLAIVSGGTAAKTVSVAEAAQMPEAGQKVQVSGNVVTDSFSTENNILQFKIYDPAGDPGTHLQVFYDGAASSTFGNDVTAICTGRINDDGSLQCSELVTKCPSKYESSSEALSVEQLLRYGDDIIGKPVKLSGTIEAGTLKAAGEGDRFTLFDNVSTQPASLRVSYDGALSEDIGENSDVVITGSMGKDGVFKASDVSIAQ